MTILNYLSKYDNELSNISKYISDKRILANLMRAGVSSLRPIQIESIDKGLFFGKNFLICTPSGSGKTLIGELSIINNIFSKKGKGIYLVPYKALATEKYRYFRKFYDEYSIKTALSIGDMEIDESELRKADIIVTTFEKLDSLLRNQKDSNKWVKKLATVVIDEVHVLGDPSRGFKIESLIIRLLANLYGIQMICLSATISNPENLCSWLNQLSEKLCNNNFFLIKSDVRPVKLHYKIEKVKNNNKDSSIRQLIKDCIQASGQILIFVNTRKSTVMSAKKYRNITKKSLDDISINHLSEKSDEMKKIRGGSPDLRSLIKDGIAFHNAGLLPQERHMIEELYRKRYVKVICCTTTLAAGVNTPARLVILRDFKKRIIRNTIDPLSFSNSNSETIEELPGSERGYFIPFSNNQTFQLLGRAGRPGLDLKGEGIILVNSQEEFEWVEDHYFKKDYKNMEYSPKYNPIISSFNKIGALREQILLRAHEMDGVTIKQLIKFFEKTYFSYNFRKDLKLERYLLLRNLDTKTLLLMHIDQDILIKIVELVKNIKIHKMQKDILSASIHLNRIYALKFDINRGINCSCGFKMNPEELKSKSFICNNYNLCEHIIAFLGYLITSKSNSTKILNYLDGIIPEAMKSERIIDFLIREGFLIQEDDKYFPTAFGELTIQLYLKPIEMVYLRNIIQNMVLFTQMDILDASCKFLQMRGRYYNDFYNTAIKMWVSEESIEDILNFSEKLVAGDFFSFKEEIVRVLGYLEAVARFFDQSEVSEMAQTLSMRASNGIKEDLLDVVVRIKGVGRIRGRKLINAGFGSVSDIFSSDPQKIHEKTGIPLSASEKIYISSKNIKKQLMKMI
ncbi:MAG: DEAD/DEAH box helicase [archaeon]|nr:DEAD/DEAH box helicase [archaeon]